jgi:hypothetical protein
MPPTQKKLVRADQIARAFGLSDNMVVLRLFRERKIPGFRLGYRTVLFDPEKVREALERLETKAVN